MTIFGYTLPQIRKTLVALAGTLTTLLAANLLPTAWAPWISTAAGVLTVLGTYTVPNAPASAVEHGRHEAPEGHTP